MADSSFESKITVLGARLRAENEANERDHLERDVGGGISPRHGSGRNRPRQLGDMGTPTRMRKQLDLPVGNFVQPKSQAASEIDNKMKEIMEMSGLLTIDGKKYQTDLKDMEHLGELGNGTCGHVVKMRHKLSQTVIAVKQMRRSGNSEENKRIIMDLDVVLKSHDCPYIVRCLGCFITEADVWICMELMATCFDKLLKRFRQPVPENILGKVTLATVKALHYLKESHGVIHRDVKPSNILLDERGNVKLCDFGISGRLVDSKAKTKNAGCAAYMAPERIDPPDPRKPDYDIRADVWSLGITLVELATGVFPYKDCKSDFEVLSKVLQEDPPTLPAEKGFTPEFQNFVKCCLTKNYSHRPKYKKLLEHPWLRRFESEEVNVAEWYAQTTSQCDTKAPATPTNSQTRKFIPPPTTAPRRHVPLPAPSNHNHRMVSEATGLQANGDVGSSGRFSPFRAAEPPPVSPRLSASPVPSEWDRNRNVGLDSPLQARKRYPFDGVTTFSSQNQSSPYHYQTNTYLQTQAQNNHTTSHHPSNYNAFIHGSSSPSALQHFHHQQQFQTQPQQPPASHSYPVTHHRSTSVSPCRQYTSEGIKVEDNNGKKRFSSCVKVHLGSALPPQRISRHSSPGPPAPSSSPDPPPRHNRVASPLVIRRNYLESVSPVPTRRDNGSPSLSRRHISPSPPQPPPRRLSECSSVPGSPQHSQRQLARFHTPEPQRRVWSNPTADIHSHNL
ncbi:dual specificity mitogen-activated protein kinase kinase 7-like [Lycorma delicatula]|uniref:dual specificity mitogen-activated protein kinase kinase 7-like n=1 Tax=Lycorma delicatula TaxID=130591 RepID=UPI003F512BD7